MKQCPQCKKIYDDAALFCEECGTKLVEMPTAEPDRTAAVFDTEKKTVVEQDGFRTAQDDRGYAQPTGYNDSRTMQNPQQGNGRIESHVGGQSRPNNQRDYNDARNYGPRNYGEQNRQRPVPPRPRKPKKSIKLGKKFWIAMAELVLLIALIVVFNAVGNSKTDPVDTATAYFNAMVEGDYDTIAALTNLPEGQFLTKEAFNKACESWSLINSDSKITKVNASEYKGYDGYGGYESYGDYGSYVGAERAPAGLSNYVKTIVVEYMLAGDPNVYSYHLQLTSGEEKVMFFFNKWEVVECTPFLAKDFTVIVPTGATLVVDGYVVDNSFQQAPTDEYDAEGDSYQLDLFVGTHTLQVLVDGFDPMTREYELSGDNDYINFCYDDSFTVSDGTKNAVILQGKTLMQQVFAAALAKDDAATALTGFGANTIESMTGAYDDFVEDLYWYEDRTMTKITLEEFDPYSCYATVRDGITYLYLDLEFKATFDYTYRDGATKKSDSYYDYMGFGAYYQYLDGVWTPVEYGYFY